MEGWNPSHQSCTLDSTQRVQKFRSEPGAIRALFHRDSGNRNNDRYANNLAAAVISKIKSIDRRDPRQSSTLENPLFLIQEFSRVPSLTNGKNAVSCNWWLHCF